MPSLAPSDDEGAGNEKLPDVTTSLDLLARPVVLGTVPKFGFTRVPEATGDGPESESDYDVDSKIDSPISEAVADQLDVASRMLR